jgi:HlyD family secretion protein
MIPGNAKIMRIVEDGDLRLRFAVPPKQARGFAPGVKVTAEIDSIETPVSATIRRVAGTIDAASGMIIIDADLVIDPAIVHDLRPGLAAWVTL